MQRRTLQHQNTNTEVSLELYEDLKELRELGLTEEDIQGYLEFYIDNYELVPISKGD